MSISTDVLETEILNLPIAERARLVEKLIMSLDIEPDVEAAWAAEVERRHAEVESGSIAIIYTAVVQEIQVFAVAHQSRRPGYWKSRNW